MEERNPTQKRTPKKPRTINTEALLNNVKRFPDATQAERAARIGVTQSTICKALRRLKISRKKTLHHPQADEQKRQHFKEELTAYTEAGYNIVYLDESGFEKQTFRTHGYAPIGEKCIATHNWQKMPVRTNAIGAIGEGKLFALRLFDCPIDGDIFHVWLNKALLPELKKPTVIVMDNAAFHKRQDIIEAVERTEHKILWLPPYSPDLNPIEKTWAWVKRLRKQWWLDCVDTLFFWILTIVSVF